MAIMNLSKAHQVRFVTAILTFPQILPNFGKGTSLGLPWLEVKAQLRVARLYLTEEYKVLVSRLMG